MDIKRQRRKFQQQPQEHQNKWKNINVEYSLNSYGFRSEEFKDREWIDSICFIGCSNTFGVGVPKEDTWAYKVAKHFNIAECNLGTPGISIDGVFRLYNYWQRIHRSKLTVLMTPPLDRFETVKNDKIAKFGSWTLDQLNIPNKRYMLDNVLNPADSYFRFVRAYNAIKNVANETDSDLISMSYNIEDGPETARDNVHLGFAWHNNIASRLIKHVESLQN